MYKIESLNLVDIFPKKIVFFILNLIIKKIIEFGLRESNMYKNFVV